MSINNPDIKLYLKFNGSDGDTSFTDDSSLALSVVNDSVKSVNLDTSVKKFGTASIEFNPPAVKYTESGSSNGTDGIPTMTSNSDPEGTASASTEYSATYSAWKSMDGDSNTYWSTTIAGVTPCWLEYEFVTSRIAVSYEITSRADASNGAPKDWTFEGWNGSSWDVLDTQTGITGWGLGEKKTYTFSNSTPYTKYRINISANNGRTTTNIASFQILPSAGTAKINITGHGLSSGDKILIVGMYVAPSYTYTEVDTVLDANNFTVTADLSGALVYNKAVYYFGQYKAYVDNSAGAMSLGPNGYGIRFWARYNTPQSDLVTFEASNGDTQLQFYMDEATKILSVDTLQSTTALSVDTWHHIEYNFLNGFKSLYIDGVREDTNADSYLSNSDDPYYYTPYLIRLFSKGTGSSEGSTGHLYIDDLQIKSDGVFHDPICTLFAVPTGEYADDTTTEVSGLGLEVETNSGDIKVTNVGLEVETNSGDIKVTNVGLEVETNASEIMVSGIALMVEYQLPEGQIKRYEGGTWTAHPLKRYEGGSWVAHTVKRWNGSSWV